MTNSYASYKISSMHLYANISFGKNAKYSENLNKNKYMKCFRACKKFQPYITKYTDKKRIIVKKLNTLKILSIKQLVNKC